MSELLYSMVLLSIGVFIGWLYADRQNKRRDERIEEGIKDLQNHRDEIIGKEGNEA